MACGREDIALQNCSASWAVYNSGKLEGFGSLRWLSKISLADRESLETRRVNDKVMVGDKYRSQRWIVQVKELW